MLKNYFAASRFLGFAYLTLVITFVLAFPMLSKAATWQWQNNGINERVTIDLDTDQGKFQAKRNGIHSILLPITINNALNLVGNAPNTGKLTLNAIKTPEGLEIQLENSAFGFFVRQASPKQIIVDIFPDPLGARWQPDGKLAPAGTKPTKAAEVIDPPTQPAIPSVQAPAENAAPAAIMPPEGSVQEAQIPVPTPEQSPAPTTPEITPQTPTMPPETAPVQEPDSSELPLKEANGSLRAENDDDENDDNDSDDNINDDDNDNDLIEEDDENDVDDDLSNKPSLSTMAMDLQGPDNILVAVADLDENNTDTNNIAATTTETAPQAEVTTNEPSSSTMGKIITPQHVGGNINTQGPEYWPADESLNTTLDGASTSVQAPTTATTPDSTAGGTTEPASTGDIQGAPETDSSTQATNADTPETPAAVSEAIATEGKPAAPEVEEVERPVIYMDEEGNVIEKPVDPEELFAQAQKFIEESKYTEAVPLLEQLKAMPNLDPARREQILYDLSDSLFIMYEGKPLEGFDPIVSATNEAMNVNLRSSRVPDALYRLGIAHLGVGNFAETEGYFKALKRRHPHDINIPTAFYQLGKGLFDAGRHEDSIKHFKMVIEEYPDASSLDEATIALVKALIETKNYEEAKVFADFVSLRWARAYVEDPDYIDYLARLDYNLGNKEGALKQYWLLYNLDPKNERSSNVLAKIGDLYFETKRPKAALEVFGEIEARFPNSDAAALAYLRRSEKGIYDSPINLGEMYAVFENPGTPLPQVAYKTLQNNRPTDKRSITAGLKYAIWQLWNKEYADAMGSAADFIDLHPENTDVELAKDIIMRGFMADLKNSLAEENYGRVLILWNGFPIVRERYGPIDSELRNALGRGYLEKGEDEKAMEMLAQFLQTPMDPRYSEPTFALYFNKYLDSKNWNAMLDLAEIVKDWDLDPSIRGQLDYAMALSAQSLRLQDKALELWHSLIDNPNIHLYQRAYATYFLAKDAEDRQDIQDAYNYNLATLELFQELQEERSDRANIDLIKESIVSLMDITEVSNRIPEALEWVEKYGEYVPEGSEEYPGLRFREARLNRKLGNDERAKLLLEIIVTDYANSPFASAASTELSTFNMTRDLRNFMPTAQGS